MHKFRIYECHSLVTGTFYEVHRRVLFWWRPVKVWYQPEIVDMPGCFTTQIFSLREAEQVVAALERGDNPSKLKLTRQVARCK